MRYSKQHKVDVHSQIVEAASVLFREKGARGIGVANLMQEVGLTHGGFYLHFQSREELFIEAFTHAMDRSTDRWRRSTGRTAHSERLAVIIDAYLSPEHRDNRGSGCAVSALGAEIAREAPKVRRAYAKKLDEMIGAIAELSPEGDNALARKGAMALLSMMMGTLVLARAAGNGELSGQILAAGREVTLAQADMYRMSMGQSRKTSSKGS